MTEVMVNRNELVGFPRRTHLGTYVLSKAIPAFERAGLIAKLPRGAELEIAGEGFSEQSVQVRSNGIAYTVFWRDIEGDVDDRES